MMKQLVKLTAFGILFFIGLAWGRDWSQIQSTQQIEIGVRDSGLTTYWSQGESHKGLAYDIAMGFAKDMALQPRWVNVKSFSDYWQKNGTNLLLTKQVAVPDIFNKLDFAADIITVTPVRQKLVTLIPWIDNVELFYGARGLGIHSYKDLLGKTLITYEGMSYMEFLPRIFQQKNLPYRITYLTRSETGQLIKPEGFTPAKDAINLLLIPEKLRLKGHSLFKEVAQGFADLSVSDGINVLTTLYNDDFYKAYLEPYIPARSKLSQLAFATSPKNKALVEKLQRYMEKIHKDGRLSHWLEEYTGFTLKDYQNLIKGL